MKNKILKLRKQGLTYNQIVKEVGCSKATVSYYCGKGQKQKAAIRNMKNRAVKMKYQKTKRDFLKRFLRRYKQLKGCSKCGIKDWRVLECDHVDPSTKEFRISDLWKWGHSIDLLKAELRKCDILCANCHRIKTIESKDYSK